MARRQAVSLEVEGLKRLRKDLRAMGDDLSDLKDVNASVAQLVAARASARAPRRSGRLAASVRGNRALSRATVLAGKAAVPYAGPVHWGWPSHGIAANPFMSEAAQETEPVWVELYRRGIEKATEKVAGHTY